MRKINYAAALATTASVALLSGAAHADGMAGAPGPCTTTQINPGHNDCVMPTATVPGGGSFPGSFLVPGTNTSFALHGFTRRSGESRRRPPKSFDGRTEFS